MKFNKTLLSAVCGCVLGFSASANAGAVITDGSTSMEKVMGILIESFEGNGIDVTYNPTGSGAGITAALEGRADIGLSSRALKDQEQEKLSMQSLRHLPNLSAKYFLHISLIPVHRRLWSSW